MAGGAERIAVVLFNLGGPDRPESVKPFLFNLFYDPAILTLPNPVRWFLAKLISSRRAPTARDIYRRMGGSSPLLAKTEAQAKALEEELSDIGDVRVFVAMRYWNPHAADALSRVKAFQPDRVVLLPLYPQYSVTTSGSSIDEWFRKAGEEGIDVATSTVCCYPDLPGLVSSFAEMVIAAVRKAAGAGPVKVIVSAHGLPERMVTKGDPYQWQVERSADALRAVVNEALGPGFQVEWTLAYQSRATPEAWLKPDTEEEIKVAATAGKAIVVVPIAFVSEHSETLVELDVEYGGMAERLGAAAYERIAAVGTKPAFIGGLGRLVRQAARSPGAICTASGSRICPSRFSGCPNRGEADRGP